MPQIALLVPRPRNSLFPFLGPGLGIGHEERVALQRNLHARIRLTRPYSNRPLFRALHSELWALCRGTSLS